MNIRQQLATSLQQSVKSLTGLEVEPQVEASSDLSKGDFSTNVAMLVFAKAKNHEARIMKHGSPMELADGIVELLNTKYKISDTFRLVEAKEPGFINFWLSQPQIIKQIDRVLKPTEEIGLAAKSSLLFEFGDPNPFKEPHIGHVRIFALGEAICRLNEANGIKVVRASYQGDVGMHVAKAIWGMIKLGFDTVEKEPLEKKAEFLGKAYSTGAEAFEKEDSVKQEIIDINRKVYEKDSTFAKASADKPEILKIWEMGRKWSLDNFDLLYKKLGIKYDKFYFESETAPEGLKIVEEYVDKVFEKDDGAIIFRGEKFGLHTRVFVNSEGHATYEAKDLALAVIKDKDFRDTDRSVIMTANEQAEYFKVLLAALNLVDSKIADKTTHLSMGFVNLKEGKMSSRTGNVVTADWLLEETKKRLKQGFKEVPDDVLEQVSIGAVKWSMLKFSRESNISFSIEESVQIEGNSGPYMQYAYARTQSLLEKGKKLGSEAKLRENLEPDLLALGRIICQFESVTKEAAQNFSPNILCNYLFDLAQNFNLFYEKRRVIGDPEEEQILLVVKAVGQVLEKGLFLLGIDAPKKI